MLIVDKVKKYLETLDIKGKVICALSGGCDSVVLLHILYSLGLDIVVVHLNHNWRGEESLRDEESSRTFAKSLNLEFYSETLSNKVKKTETEAREARYLFFAKCAKKYNSNFVFLAHNKNDNAETLLYRVIKGTGLKGLCSIPKQRDIFYRPLLDVERSEIEKYALENNLQYVKDSSNECIKYQRNFIRKEILPLLEKINPDAICALNNLANLSCMHYKLLSNIIDETKKEIFYDDKIILDKYLNLSLSAKYEIINDFLRNDLKYCDLKRIKSYVEFIEANHSKSSKKSIKANLFLEISNGYIFKSSPNKKNMTELKINGEGEYAFCEKKVALKKFSGPLDFKNLENAHYLSLDFSNQVVLRTRRNGDIFTPFGMKSGTMKLKDYLINKKIPRQIRDNLLLLACGNEILCILGIQISQKVAVDDKQNCFFVKIME